jgi:hypothetical protein
MWASINFVFKKETVMNKETILGVIRHILTFGGGYMVAKGWLDDALMNNMAAAIITLVGAAWSVYDKKTR